jgi:hypothetical protein
MRAFDGRDTIRASTMVGGGEIVPYLEATTCASLDPLKLRQGHLTVDIKKST